MPDVEKREILRALEASPGDNALFQRSLKQLHRTEELKLHSFIGGRISVTDIQAHILGSAERCFHPEILPILDVQRSAREGVKNAFFLQRRLTAQEFDVMVPQYFSHIEVLTHLEEHYHARLEELASCGIIPSVDNPVITAINGKTYKVPPISDIKKMTMDDLLRIQALHDGDGSPEKPARPLVLLLVPFGLRMRQLHRQIFWHLNDQEVPHDPFEDADLLRNDKSHNFLLKYEPTSYFDEEDNGMTKRDRLKKNGAWDVFFADARPETPPQELYICQKDGNERSLDGHQVHALFQWIEVDGFFPEDAMMLNLFGRSREEIILFDREYDNQCVGAFNRGNSGGEPGCFNFRNSSRTQNDRFVFWWNRVRNPMLITSDRTISPRTGIRIQLPRKHRKKKNT